MTPNSTCYIIYGEIKGNKEKSRESGGSGQGKQPWGVGRYVLVHHGQLSIYLRCFLSDIPEIE